MGLITIHESQISLSFWQGWLYKRLFMRTYFTLGIAELRIGRTAPRRHSTEKVSYFVLEGSGRLEIAGNLQPFEPGQIISIEPQQSYEFDPDHPTRLLSASATPALPAHFSEITITASERRIIDNKASPPQAVLDECYFVVGGSCLLSGENESRELKPGSAFYISVDVEYTLLNRTPSNVRLMSTYAGIAARDEAESINTT